MQKTKKINYIRKYRKILSLSIIVLLVIFTTAVPGVRGNTNEPEDTEGSAKVIGVSLDQNRRAISRRWEIFWKQKQSMIRITR